jgi:hypothetical protein
MLDHPEDLKRLSMLATLPERFAIGRLVSAADKRARGFKALYEQLSEYTHPVQSTFSESWVVRDEIRREGLWSSAPRFKQDDDPLWACFWLIELTEIHQHVWPQLYRASVPAGEDQ